MKKNSRKRLSCFLILAMFISYLSLYVAPQEVKAVSPVIPSITLANTAQLVFDADDTDAYQLVSFTPETTGYYYIEALSDYSVGSYATILGSLSSSVGTGCIVTSDNILDETATLLQTHAHYIYSGASKTYSSITDTPSFTIGYLEENTTYYVPVSTTLYDASHYSGATVNVRVTPYFTHVDSIDVSFPDSSFVYGFDPDASYEATLDNYDLIYRGTNGVDVSSNQMTLSLTSGEDTYTFTSPDNHTTSLGGYNLSFALNGERTTISGQSLLEQQQLTVSLSMYQSNGVPTSVTYGEQNNNTINVPLTVIDANANLGTLGSNIPDNDALLTDLIAATVRYTLAGAEEKNHFGDTLEDVKSFNLTPMILKGIWQIDFDSEYTSSSLDGIEIFSHLINLSMTTLPENGRGSLMDASALGNLRNLSYVDLSGNDLTSISSLASCGSLTSISVYNNPNLICVDNVWSGNPNLQFVYLNGCFETDNPDDVFDNDKLAELAGLNELLVINLPSGTYDNLNAFSTCKKLEYVSATHNQVSSLAGLTASADTLTRLEMGNNNLRNDGIACLNHMKNLRILYLANNHLTDLTALTTLNNLEYTDFSCNSQLTTLAPLASCTKMKSLVCYGAKLTNEGIACIQGMPDLEGLNLWANLLTEIPDLSAFTKLTSLYTYLFLNHYSQGAIDSYDSSKVSDSFMNSIPSFTDWKNSLCTQYESDELACNIDTSFDYKLKAELPTDYDISFDVKEYNETSEEYLNLKEELDEFLDLDIITNPDSSPFSKTVYDTIIAADLGIVTELEDDITEQKKVYIQPDTKTNPSEITINLTPDTYITDDIRIFHKNGKELEEIDPYPYNTSRTSITFASMTLSDFIICMKTSDIQPSPGAPSPGVPTPGVPTPGAPTPGVPTPGVPTPGAPSPGVPSPGVPTPAVPTSGTPTSVAPTPAVPTPSVLPKTDTEEASLVGTTFKVKGTTYKVTSNSEVSYYKAANKKVTTVTMGASIKVDGKSYKINSIAKSAFSNCKKLKKVIIGKHITTVETKAFNGCSKLKTIVFKTTKLVAVGKNAFSKISKKATFKLTGNSKTKKAIKKLLTSKNTGYKKTCKIS